MSGPTKGAELKSDPSKVWTAHPNLAGLLRLGVVLAPLVVSILFSWWVGRVAPPGELGMNRWVWLGCLFVASTVIVLLFQRLFRRVLPLVALMQLTLVFPDQAPSRARAALRASSGRSLVRRLQAGELADEGLDGAMLADLVTAINDHDRLTRGHSERVRAYTEVIGEEMGLPESEMNLLRWGALLHDVGKLTVPAEILNKDGPPTREEWQVLQGHPTAGGAILEPLRGWLGDWIHAADQHHIHWNGNGYPGGLKGLEISLPGRMVAVADAYDVMTSARSYKKPLSHEVARQELTDCAGAQFDPAIVRVFLNAGLGRLRAAVGPLTWLVNGLSSGQTPIPVAGSALSAASAAATAAIAVVVSVVGGGAAVPDTLASVASDSVVVEDVALTGSEDGLIETTLTAIGPSGPGRFTFGRPDHGTVALADAELGVEPTGDGAWGIDVHYRPDRDFHGSDRFTYTACDSEGACATATVTAAIAGVNDAPVPTADRHALTAGETAMIDVAANDRDVDGDPLSVRVVSPPRRGSVSVAGNRLEYEAPRGFVGQDVLSYSVTDPGGLSGTASLSVTVLAADPEPDPTPTTLPLPEDPPEPLPATPDPPDPDPTPPDPAPPDPPPAVNQVPVAVDDAGPGFVTAEDVAFTTPDVTANDSDTDDPVAPASATVVSSVTHGVLVRNGDGSFVYTPDPEFFGTDSFTYTITDPSGAVSAPATVTIVVVVVNDAPVATPDSGAGFTTLEDTTFRTADVTANDSDLDHAVVPSSVAVVSSVGDGMLVNHRDGTFSYTPDPEFGGVDSFTYRITDPAGAVSGPATVTLVVSPVNDAPVAVGDGGPAFVTSEEVAFRTGDVTVNDSDVDHPVVSSSVAVVSSVSDGVLVNEGDGTFTYAPDADFFGTDSFTYTIRDPAGAVSAPATVTLLVSSVNDAPVAADDAGAAFATSEDVAFITGDVTVNDSDVDHPVVASSVAVVSSVSDGVLVNEGDGTFTYTPDPDFFGVDSFTYTITDPAGALSDPATVTLTVTAVNDSPVAADDSGLGFVTSEDTGFTTADVTANDTDADHPVVATSVAVDSPTNNGGLVNHLDGTFTYTPDPDFAGLDIFTYTITDAAGAVSDPATVVLVVTGVNDPPVAMDDSGVGFTTAEDAGFTTADVTANDSDVDHSVVASSVAVVSSVTDGGLVDNGDGTFTYTPDPDFFGVDSFTYTITDPAGAVSAAATVTLTVSSVNDPPIVSADGGLGFLTTEDTAFTTADVTEDDFDVDHPVVASSVAVVSPVANGVLVNNGDGTFHYTPDPDFFGADSFRYTITDPAGAVSASGKVTLGVVPTYDPPVATDDTLDVSQGGSATTVDLRLNDLNPDLGPLLIVDVTDGTNGTAVDNGDGTATYTHDGSATFSDSFTYTIRDLIGVESTATVVVSVEPTEDFDGVAAGVDNCPFDFNPMQLDTDGDGVGDLCDASPTVPSGASFTDTGQDLGSGNSREVGVGDLDGDGDLDAVFATEGGPNTVWFNNGAGVFADSTQALGNAWSLAVALADVDGDGDLDAVFANDAAEPSTVWFNDGMGAFTNSGQALGYSRTMDIAVADVDGDGDLDLSFGNLGQANAVWLNDGSGTFSNSGQSLGSGPTAGVSFADLDGDDDPDLVFSNDGADDTVWFNDGAGTFSDSGQALGIGRTHDSVLRDLDGDGDVDIAFAGDNEGDTVWFNDGSGTFTDSGQILGLGHSRSIDAGDLDGDGDLDLVFGDHVGANTVWLNDGTGTFTDSTQTLASNATEGMILADLDGDGDLDAVAANDGDSNRVWSNS